MRSGKVKSLAVLVLAMLLVAAIAVSGEQQNVCKVSGTSEYNPSSPAAADALDDRSYLGRLLVYVVEPTSRWLDYSANKYHYGFLDFALDTTFTLAEGGSLNPTVSWNSTAAGYPDVEPTNLMVIAVLRDMSQSYPASSDTIGGSAAPFDAYYVDAAAAATVDSQWNNTVSPEFSHTVFADIGTATYCPSCPGTNSNMYFVDEYFDLPFFYAAMVVDKETTAGTFMNNQYNLNWVPTSYFDGGQHVTVGAESYAFIISHVEQAGAREVTGFGLSVSMNWLSKDDIEIHVDLAENGSPAEPATPSGATEGIVDTPCEFSTSATDPDGDQMYYRFCWEEGDTSGWYGPLNSGETCQESHTYTAGGSFDVKGQAKDSWGSETGWSAPLAITIYDYLAGDANGSGNVNILDVTFLINYLYKGGPAPDPPDAGDPNGSHTTNILDVTYIINYLYKGGPAPVYPS